MLEYEKVFFGLIFAIVAGVSTNLHAAAAAAVASAGLWEGDAQALEYERRELCGQR